MEKERGETSVCGCLSSAPCWGRSPQPRHVSQQGIEPVTHGFAGWCSIHGATPAGARQPSVRPWNISVEPPGMLHTNAEGQLRRCPTPWPAWSDPNEILKTQLPSSLHLPRLPSCKRKHEPFVQTLMSEFIGQRERSRGTLGPVGLSSTGSLPGGAWPTVRDSPRSPNALRPPPTPGGPLF